MIDETAQLHELPDYWQQKIRKLRSESHELRKRLREIPRLEGQELPPSWQKKLRKLRDENVQLRKERTAARAELAALRDELEAQSK